MNICIFDGRLGQEPEARTTPSGKMVCNASIAVSKRIKGEEKTVWIPLTFWEKTAELVTQYCHKGSRLLVRAEFGLQDWNDKDGNKRQSPQFTVFEMNFLDPKPQPDNQSGNQQQNQSGGYQEPMHNTPPAQKQDDFIEDDLPF